MVKIFCALVGEAGNAFSVTIDASESLDDLKDVIAEKQKFDFAASKLELYLAKRGDRWLTENEVQDISDTSGLKHLSAARARVNRIGLSDEEVVGEIDENEEAAGNGPVNVLVVAPTKDGGVKRQRTDAFNLKDMEDVEALVKKLNGGDELKVGKLLETPIIILGLSISKGLYIRKEYWDLYNIIEQQLRSDSSLRRILVVGSPGIGKSVFGLFLLLLFMTKHKDVAYRPLNRSLIYFTWRTDCYVSSFTPHAGRTYDGFFDGNEAGEALWLHVLFKRAFLFASPRTGNYNEFVKTKCFKVCMNPWTKSECETFADAIHLDDQDEWIRKFRLVGGKPRLVFASSEDFDDLLQRVKSDIPSNINELRNQVRHFEQKSFDGNMKHNVFNFYRDENAPSRSYLTYSSSAVEAIMRVRYQVQSADEIRGLLQTPALNLQSWRGKEIEKFLLQDLATSKFCMRALEGSSVGIVTRHGPLNAASEIIQASSEIQNKLVLYIPLSKTFPSLDGVLVVPQDGRIIYVQATVALDHPIKYQQLKNVYQDLMQRLEFLGFTHIFLFIVTNEIYDSFTVQSYKNKDGKNRKMNVDIDVTQYVGKILR
ncbi:hypothetical protein Plhal703r1_c15g0072091 [Plasmopara halstedii]